MTMMSRQCNISSNEPQWVGDEDEPLKVHNCDLCIIRPAEKKDPQANMWICNRCLKEIDELR